MTAPSPKKQALARKFLTQLFAEAENVFVIHYSCESFYDRDDGSSPRVTSIAIRNLLTAQTASFSIHQIAEIENINFSEIDQNYNKIEKIMLEKYFSFLSSHQGSKYIHWNMRDINYGFIAIEHRFSILGGIPFRLEDAKKYDLSRILIDIYGVDYISHPRLENLMVKNSIRPVDFLSGKDEAGAFDKKQYVKLHQSTLRKVDNLANIAERANHNQLLTNTGWLKMHGGGIRGAWHFVVENKSIAFVLAFLGLIIALAQIDSIMKFIKREP